MQTGSKKVQNREDIEAAIAESEEVIYKLCHALRWYTFAVRTFWLGLVTDIPGLVVGGIFNLSWVQVLGGTGLFILLILGIGILVFSASPSASGVAECKDSLRLEKQLLAKLKRQLAAYDEQAFRRLSEQEQYRHQLPDLIDSYRKSADRDYRWFVLIQIIVIVCSATVTSLAGGWLDKYVALPWIVPMLSVLVSILTSFTLFFKFREKATNLRQTADAMDLEHKACSLGIGAYKGMSKNDALVLLAERAEALRKDQQQRQQQLEQSSQAENKALQQDAQ